MPLKKISAYKFCKTDGTTEGLFICMGTFMAQFVFQSREQLRAEQANVSTCRGHGACRRGWGSIYKIVG